MRKIHWVLIDKNNKVLGVFTTKKKLLTFFDNQEEISIIKMVWNGFYYSEKPLDYDPYRSGKVSLYDPMF